MSCQVCKEQETFLTERNIALLKRMFSNETKYIEYMETLWVLRDLALKAIEVPTEQGTRDDENHPYFRIAMLTNELIGSLLRGDINFDFGGVSVWHYKSGVVLRSGNESKPQKHSNNTVQPMPDGQRCA